MREVIELIIKNIEEVTYSIVSSLNNYYYEVDWAIILLGFIITLGFIFCIIRKDNINNYLYKREISKLSKLSLFTIITSHVLGSVSNEASNNILVVFPTLTLLIPVGLIIGYILDKHFFFKHTKCNKVEVRYLNYIIVYTYILMLALSMKGVRYTILIVIWQFNYVTLKFLLEKKSVDKKNKSDLYVTRKKQLNILTDIIKSSDYDNYAIALNGEWGSGKSEFIKALIEEHENNNFHVYIRPMVGDTQESLITTFQKSISKLMKENGIYSGRSSSLNKYFKEIFKLIELNNQITLSNIMELSTDNNLYGDLKEELQKDIDSLLLSNKQSDKRLIVIIDDFDRLDEDKQLGILTFIKEIIDFKGCIIIIALDYENLKNNKIVKPEYLEKFIATQLPLVDMEFHEIIEFHVDDILNEDIMKNDFSKKILRDIRENIYEYYYNIEKRVTTHYSKLNDNVKKIKEQDKQKVEKAKLDDFLDFSIERIKNIDNSRRVIHFLKEIQSTIILIDRLYDNREDRDALLEMVNVSEVIYFFNYIKVYYKEAYESIVKTKGIEEYLAYLHRKGKSLEKEYFEVILEDIIPNTNYFFKDEKKELCRVNNLNLVKDLFINFYFTKNNIELFTNYEKVLSEIDNKEISITEDHVEKIQVYQEIILKHSEGEEILSKRVNSLNEYLIVLYNDKIVDLTIFLQLSTSRYSMGRIKYVKHYLETVLRLLEKDRAANKIYEKDKVNIEYYLKQIEMSNIMHYRYVFVELLTIISLDSFNDNEIEKSLKEIDTTEVLVEKVKQYCIENKIISKEGCPEDPEELVVMLIEITKNKKYRVIDIDLLEKRINEFMINHKYIMKLRNIEINVDSTDRFKVLSQYFTISNISEAKTMLTDLANEEDMNSDRISCFQQLIRYIVSQEHFQTIVDEQCKSDVQKIYSKITKEDCWNEYAWFNIMVNVERILNVTNVTVRTTNR